MRASTLLIGALPACALAGCNPSSFNSLLDQAPVVSLSPGGSSTSSLAVLPLPFPSEPGTTSAARVLLSLRDTPHLAVADFDMNGKVTLTSASDSELKNLAGVAVHSMAMRADLKIVLGTPKAGGGPTPVGGVSILDLTPSGKGAYSFLIKAGAPGGNTDTRLGTAVAAGNINNIPEGNFIAIGDSTVQVLDGTGTAVAAATPPGCASVQYASSELYPYRPVAVGDVRLGGFEEIVLGMPGAPGTPGKVVIVQWDSSTQALTCPSTYLSMNGAPMFGSSVAVADFNGDLQPDLAVGNPPDTVYVFFGPLADSLFVPGTVPVPSVTIKSPSSTSFGQRVASYPRGQLLVADPDATINGRHGAGKVMLFSPAGQPSLLQADTSALATLFDATAGSDPGLFGLNLGGVEFNPELCPAGATLPIQLVPWASNGQNLLAFFNYFGLRQDPRCFAIKP